MVAFYFQTKSPCKLETPTGFAPALSGLQPLASLLGGAAFRHGVKRDLVDGICTRSATVTE